jgi:hypothetical protein
MRLDADWRFDHVRVHCPNHPNWKAYPGYPESNWGPAIGEWFCNLMDWLTGGYAHD